MSRGWVAVFAWGVNLAILWALSWSVFDADTETIVLLASAFTLTWLMALGALVAGRRDPRPESRPTVVPGTSHATALAGAALVGLLLAAEFGPWLLYVAGGLLALAVGGLVRERLAVRRTLEDLDGGPA